MFTQNSESLRGESCADTPFGHNVQAVLTLVWGKIHVVFFPLLPCGGEGEPQASYRPLLHTNSYLVSEGGEAASSLCSQTREDRYGSLSSLC